MPKVIEFSLRKAKRDIERRRLSYEGVPKFKAVKESDEITTKDFLKLLEMQRKLAFLTGRLKDRN